MLASLDKLFFLAVWVCPPSSGAQPFLLIEDSHPGMRQCGGAANVAVWSCILNGSRLQCCNSYADVDGRPCSLVIL